MTKILGVDITPNDKSLTFSKISDIPSGNLMGRVSEGSGEMETLNPSTVRTLLDVPVTGHTHPSILTATITDGDTTHAPDGNSVFDALALKSDTNHTHPSILTTVITDGDTTHAPDGNSVFDALALKSDTNHTHPSILTATITDGDTTHAPDGNSVFDALALKSDTNHTHPVVNTYSTVFYNVRR